MHKILQFFYKFRVMFLFILLEGISLVLLVRNNKYQQTVYLSSANDFTARMYEWSSSITDFFKLKSTNAQLAAENAQLLNQINDLENRLVMAEERANGIENPRLPSENQLDYIPAKVINNSTNHLKNYITINKGALDGIEPDMGVVSSSGAVGIIKNVSEHFAVIVPLLNPTLKLNCKLKTSNYSGPLVWDGTDARYSDMKDIARHVQVQVGDTIITSGLSSTFPEGIAVGTVKICELDDSDMFHKIKVELATNFSTLTYVQVIRNANKKEQQQLEQRSTQDSNKK
ncbi:MAG: rod shape-determining protein MreC [Paludibacteraceae bacterium]|nr:rod shape-determining protein MreC [Paludibacteraceae bacterium]